MRLDSLTGLRWWAAFGVFAFHMRNFAPIRIDPVLEFGNDGVMFFFVLSGFVLTWSARPGVSAVTFWLRRFARIYPSHFVALLVAIPVFYSFSPDPSEPWVKPFNLGILALSVVLVQGWSNVPAILFSGNPAAWTLTCEAFFYAVHPFINRFLRTIALRGTFLVALAIVALGFAYQAAVIAWPTSFVDAPLPITRLDEFALGMCAAHAMRMGWRPRLPPFVAYLAGAGFVLWLYLSPRHFPGGIVGSIIRNSAEEWLVLLCSLLIVTVAARDLRGGRSLLRWKPLVLLGDWSYAFYLLHATIIYAAIETIGVRPGSWFNLAWYAAMLVVAIGCAAALHYVVERPFERRIRAWWDRRLLRRVEATRDAT